MQLRKCTMHVNYVVAAPDDTAHASDSFAAHRAELVTLLFGAVEALERRRVADTLLEGKCTAAEEAWSASETQRNNPDWPPAETASFAALVGYEQLLHAAMDAASVLARARLFSAECSDAHFQSFTQNVVLAAELMQKPRRLENIAMARGCGG